ncbi:MAG: ATP-dependent DNA helicase RecG [Nitrospirota bacterium]|nr:MAG: ATP-dependent DNA helicase RecG [Nitrospirota bacterium]
MISQPEPDGAEALHSLRQSLSHLERLIQIASQSSSSQRSSGENLGTDVADHIMQILSSSFLPPSVETILLHLKQVFSGYDEILAQEARELRIAEGQRILARLQNYRQLQLRDLGSSSPSGFQKATEYRDSGETLVGIAAQLSIEESRSEELTGKRRRETLSDTSVQYAKGVGPNRAALLNKLGVITIEDALWFLPWRYEDRSVISFIRSLQPGMKATICGTIKGHSLHRTARRGLMVLNVRVDDGSGLLECVFFNQPYLEKIFSDGTQVLMNGTVSVNRYGTKSFQMRGPQYEVLEGDGLDQNGSGIVPIYHETKGLTSRQIRRIFRGLHHQFGHAVEEIFPSDLTSRLQLPSLADALEQLHFPNGEEDIDQLNQGTTAAHRRLIFEEFFSLQLALAIRRRMVKTESQGISFAVDNELVGRLQAKLPFPLTPSQERVIEEIRSDMAQAKCMNRLIQGDVGSGKTVVALHAILMACGSGYQAALMAPTEVLSEQHYFTLLPYFRALGIKTVLLKGGQSKQERNQTLGKLHSGDAQIAIGTHALLQPDVHFAKLGLVVIDEQHKFGVLQRARLRGKGGERPDVLVMTATPIPRTLSLTVYGDLDVSVIDQLPPGRKPVHTRLFRASETKRAYAILRREVEAGRQGYIVYPLVEQSEKLDLQAAIQAAERLQQDEFPTKRIGLLHGRMKSKEKQAVMNGFKDGTIQILVATTVIEVGVDVPNASVMLIEDADRFGLAQLHQLRGRVGRGSDQAYCLLIARSGKTTTYQESGPRNGQIPIGEGNSVTVPPLLASGVSASSSRKRLEVLVRCSDGFRLAEEDLKIRGPGDFLGVRQWGGIDFRVADLVRDHALLIRARNESLSMMNKDPELNFPQHKVLKTSVLRRWGGKFELGSVG